ncbi:MAG TPA: AAA family ATPase [Solirubrobacteraceae bacterium]|nr:AAA family ATPase [Solirubrobacteraceae bacterium]
MGDVSVSLLGGFAAAVDGVPVPDAAWRLKKARELVKLLALAPGHRLHREQVMDVLWRDREPAAAANNLHQAVYVARRALDGNAIVVREELLHLAADVDVDRLVVAAADARRARTPAAYRAALSLYGGELLPENRYDDWAEARRDELTELAEELADGAAVGPADPGGPSPLPVDASSFVGRDRELAELKALLRNTRLLTLAGTGGVGKTRLALELARSAERSYPGGAVLVELAAQEDARLVPDQVAAALDVQAPPGQELIDAVVEFLSPRSLLLVLDNCEHLLAETAGLADTLLRSAPALTILATSREPLRVPGEVVFRVPSLDIPDPEQKAEPRELMGYEAVRLFVERADRASGFVLDDENAVDVARICFRLDGLPLALELAAGRVGALGPSAIAGRLDDRFRVLRSVSHASPTRQQTLKSALQWSHDLLEPDERILFRRLAMFAGGFELGAVESVCAWGEVDRSGIADVLARLVEKSLVAADEGSSRERRYRLLETVRVYARERLDEAAETYALAQRHANWALALAEQERGSPRLDREAANLRVGLDTLLDRRPNGALRLCVALWRFWLRRIELHEAQRRFDEALAAAPERTALRAQALLGAAAIDFRSGALSRGLPLAEQSRALASEIGDARAECRALQFLGEFGLASDAADVGMPWLERALELARREGFAAAEAICVYSVGVAHWSLGDLPRAEQLVARSIELFGPLAGSPERILSPVNIAEIRRSPPGGRPRLRIVFEDTLQPFAEISCDTAISYILANQAGIASARGDLRRARALLDESAARFEDAGYEPGKAAVLVRRAYLELAEGALATAREHLEQALELRRAQSDRRGLGLVLAGLGLIDTAAGEYASADRLLAEARELFRRAGDRWGLGSTLWRTADLAFARGNVDDAEVALLEARAVLGATGRERWIANTVVGLAEIALLRGDLQRACALFADARDRYATRDDALGVAEVEERLRGLC